MAFSLSCVVQRRAARRRRPGAVDDRDACRARLRAIAFASSRPARPGPTPRRARRAAPRPRRSPRAATAPRRTARRTRARRRSCRPRPRAAACPAGTPITGTPSARASSASLPPVVSDHAPRAGRAGGLEAGERLLGVARVARAQRPALSGPVHDSQRVAAHRRDRRAWRGRRARRRRGRRRSPSRPCRTRPARRARSRALDAGRLARARARRRAGAAAPARRRACRSGHRLDRLAVERHGSIRRAPGSIRAPALDAPRPSPITAPAPTIAPGPTRAPSPTRTPSPSDALARPTASAPTMHAVVQHRALDARVRADRAVAPEHALRADVRAGSEAALVDQRAGLVARGQRRLDAPGEQVPGRLEVALGRPDVDPVARRRRSRTGRCRPAAGTPRARTRRRGRPGSTRPPTRSST